MKQLINLTAILFTIISCFSQTKEQDSLTIQLAFQNQNYAKVETSIKLIKSLYTTNNLKKALLYLNQSEKLSSNLQYTKGTAELKYYKALIYTKKEDYFNAIDNFNKSLQLFSQLKDTLGIAKVNNSIGIIEIKRRNYTRGLNYSLSAIKIFKKRNLKSELALAYQNLSEAYFNTKQFDKALDFNIKTLLIKEQLKDRTGIISSTTTIAKLYSMRKEHRKAIEYYEKALNLLDPVNERNSIAEILPKIGAEYLQFNDFKKASNYLLKGLRLNRRIQNKAGILESYNRLANLNFKLKKIRLAESQLDEASKLINQVKNDSELLEYYKLKIAIDSIKRDYKNAFKWQTRYHVLKSKIEKENEVPVYNEEPQEIDSPINNYVIPEGIKDEDSSSKNLKLIIYSLIVLLCVLIVFILRKRFQKNKNIQNVDTSKLEEKIKTLTLDNKSLLEENISLEESNQVKDRLFSIVSHDLKDSITSIKAFLDLLKEDSITKEEFNNLIPELSQNANNAEALLLNLLNWSKSQMQNLKPEPQKFNIQDVFKEKMNLFQKGAQEKRIILLDESIKDMVYADKSMIEIVIQNLLANALKFSKIGDVITISNRIRNGKALICIEDTGVGISKENQGKLFANTGFTTRGTQDEKGTGLGLTICKELIELNNGKIWVESEPNLGSKFFVELPKS